MIHRLGQMDTPFAAYVSQSQFNGVDFLDIDPLLMNPNVRDIAVSYLSGRLSALKPTHLLGVESRGFGLAAHMAQVTGLSWAMARKAGKTPGKVLQKTFEAEYGPSRTLELKETIFKPGDRVAIVDDVLATGGTAAAMVELVQATGATVVACVFLAEIMELKGAAKYNGITTISLIKVTPQTVFGRGAPALPPQAPSASASALPPQQAPLAPPQAPLASTSASTSKIIVMAHPLQYNVANDLVANFPDHMELGNISWEYFADGMPNISFDPKLENRDVLFLASLEDRSRILEQIMMLIVLSRQGVRSLVFYAPYFSMGTNERVEKEGQVATADPMATLLSTNIARTKTGPVILTHDTIHALQERFFYDDGVRLHLSTHTIKPPSGTVIVFPDEGAYKRFNGLYKEYPQIVCSKVRVGDKRIVTIKETIGSFEPGGQAIIVDDLVQTGGTLHECYLRIKDMFAEVYASVTHAVFPNACFLDFLPGGSKAGFKGFYITDSVPGTVEKIRLLHLDGPDGFFIVKKLAQDFCLNVYPSLVDRKVQASTISNNINDTIYRVQRIYKDSSDRGKALAALATGKYDYDVIAALPDFALECMLNYLIGRQ